MKISLKTQVALTGAFFNMVEKCFRLWPYISLLSTSYYSPTEWTEQEDYHSFLPLPSLPLISIYSLLFDIILFLHTKSETSSSTNTTLLNRYHYTNNQRIENIILDTSLNTRLVTNSDRDCKKAIHGYNNLEASMQVCVMCRHCLVQRKWVCWCGKALVCL